MVFDECPGFLVLYKFFEKWYKLLHYIFSRHVQENLRTSKTLLIHEATELFYEANWLSLKLRKQHNFMNRIFQNISHMIKNFKHTHSHKTIQQTLPPPGRKQMEIYQTPRNDPKPNQLSILHHRNGSPQPRTKICNRYTQKHHHKNYTWQLLELHHWLFEMCHPRNHLHRYLPKIYLQFQNKKSFMKPDTFDFKSLPSFLL